MNLEKSKMKKYFQLAQKKSTSPYEFPENKKQLLIVSNNYRLIDALENMAWQEDAQLRHARPCTPDIYVFAASVKIIDRRYLGARDWQTYCELLEDLNNDTTEYPVRDEDGEILLEAPLYDETPVIIIDTNPGGFAGDENFIVPEYARGEVFYIDQRYVAQVVQAAQRLLRKSKIEVSPVRAVSEEEAQMVKKGKT